MKVEINIENKSRFIALYTPYGEIWKKSNEGHQLKVATGNICLNLKSLSSISDEDVIQLSKLMDENFEGFGHTDIPVEEIVEFRNDIVQVLEEIYYPLVIADFLRSRRYALPYLGISVEEQIEAGWIKLIEA